MPASGAVSVLRVPGQESVWQQGAQTVSTFLGGLDRPILLLLSGGSALGVAERIADDCVKNNLTIGMLDDRFSLETAANNFQAFIITRLYRQAEAAGATFIDSRPKIGEALPVYAERLDSHLKQWRASNPHGDVVALMGLGADGHTAGIMPFAEDPKFFRQLFEDTDRWVVGYNAAGKNPYSERVTVTMPFLRHQVGAAVMVVSGARKAGALCQVVAATGPLAEFPGRIIHHMRQVCLITDCYF